MRHPLAFLKRTYNVPVTKIRLPVPTKGIANSPRPNQNILSSIINPKKNVLGSEIWQHRMRLGKKNCDAVRTINQALSQ